ncbi:MAG: hypothetical protein ACK4FG_04575 [Brevundimonas sp.]|jgi:hypothetical protein
MTMMLATMLAALAIQGRGTPPVDWTWALYEGDTLTLANEIPDTPRLRATFECDPGSSVAKLTLYGGAPSANGLAQVQAGQSTATATVRNGARGSGILTVRTDHPVFSAFMSSGQMTVRASDASVTVVVEADHLAKLRRFAELCAG